MSSNKLGILDCFGYFLCGPYSTDTAKFNITTYHSHNMQVKVTLKYKGRSLHETTSNETVITILPNDLSLLHDTVLAKRRLSLANAKADSFKRHRCGTTTSQYTRRSGEKPSWMSRQMGWLERNASVPINRFLYWEFSKAIYYAILISTLISATKDGEIERVTCFAFVHSIKWFDLIILCFLINVHRYI